MVCSTTSFCLVLCRVGEFEGVQKWDFSGFSRAEQLYTWAGFIVLRVAGNAACCGLLLA